MQSASLTLGLLKTYTMNRTDPGSIRDHENRQRPSHQYFIARPDSPLSPELYESADGHHPSLHLLLLERRLCLRKHIPSCEIRIFCTLGEASKFYLDTPQGMRRLKRTKNTCVLYSLFGSPTAQAHMMPVRTFCTTMWWSAWIDRLLQFACLALARFLCKASSALYT